MADSAIKKQKEALKAASKEAKAAKRAQRKNNRKQLWAAFKMQSSTDKALIPLMLLSIVGVGLIFFLLGLLWHGQWAMLILGLVLGFLLAMYIFTKRVERSVYAKAEGEAGAAGWALENLRNGPGVEWHAKTGVAMNTHMDIVHRVVGACGIVLVAEGEDHRVRPLVAQYKKRLVRFAGSAPIYEIYTGTGKNQVPLRKLQRELMKLPRNLKKNQIGPLASRVEAMDANGQATGLPKGPIPRGSMAGMNRRARRAQGRR